MCCNTEDDLGLLDVHAVVSCDTLIAIITEVAHAVGRRIVREFHGFFRVHAAVDVIGSHLNDFFVVTAYTEFFGYNLGDLTAAAAELTRNCD